MTENFILGLLFGAPKFVGAAWVDMGEFPFEFIPFPSLLPSYYNISL
jgi:hypothetical protein